jgi:hypothetical protein
MTYTDKQIRSFLMSIDMPAWSGSTPHIRGVGRILEALREPTEEMVAATDQFDWGPPGYDDAPGGAASETKVWQAMLDARMGEG